MGTINYFTSDFITIGYNLNNIDYDDQCYSEFIQDDFNEVEWMLNIEKFYYFNVALIPGYYEGFSIDIELNYKYCFDNYHDKIEAQKEITQIKKFLLDCINFCGCCAVSPGWCTKYAKKDESIKLLNEAIKEMRATVQAVPTWGRLPASEKYA